MHLAGALLLICGGYLVGYETARQMTYKVKLLYGVIATLTDIRSEINARQTPFPEIFRRLAASPGEIGRFFADLDAQDARPIRQCWEESVQTHLARLSPECREVLLTLGAGIGKSMAEEQIRLLDEAIRRLEEIHTREAAQTRSSTRLWRRICPGIAAAAAILLM